MNGSQQQMKFQDCFLKKYIASCNDNQSGNRLKYAIELVLHPLVNKTITFCAGFLDWESLTQE